MWCVGQQSLKILQIHMHPKGKIVPQRPDLFPPGHAEGNIIRRDGWSPARKRTGYVIRATSVTFTSPVLISGRGGGGAAYNIQSVLRRTSLLRERMSHITQGDPNHQHNILIRGVKGGPEPVLQWWEGRSQRKKSLWRDNISQLREDTTDRGKTLISFGSLKTAAVLPWLNKTPEHAGSTLVCSRMRLHWFILRLFNDTTSILM
jgi:hypothetical protein